VTTLALLDDEPQRFTTDTIVGYVLRDDGDNGDLKKGQIIALSAACTHMGCLVRWHASDRTFHCPCHGGLFTENGFVDKRSNLLGHLSPLPRLETKVEGGTVYVRVPISQR
jgi:Rieske Fe-S protein